MPEYDVVVIGAGNGGLSAACMLSKLGLKTLLVEKHNLPGGLATSFVRGRFEFEPSLHELCRGTEDNPTPARIVLNTYETDIEWKKLPGGYTVSVPDENGTMKSYHLPPGEDSYTSAINEIVPGSEECVREFLRLCKEVNGGMAYMGAPGITCPEVLEENYPAFLNTAGKSLKEVEDLLEMPELVRLMVNPYWTYQGLSPDLMDFQMYALLILSAVECLSYVPKLRSHEIAMALDERIRANGGTIYYHVAAEEIDIEQGAVCGVRLSNGEYIKTDHVISDIAAQTLFSKLIKPENVPEQICKTIQSRKKLMSGTTVYLGLNKPMEELGLDQYCYFTFRDRDAGKLYERMGSLDEVTQTVCCLNAVFPDCSPEGTCMLFFLVISSEDAWEDVAEKDYFKRKDEIAEKAVRFFEESEGISISEYIEEIEVATPVTFTRYTGAYKGEVIGYLPTVEDGIVAKTVMSNDDYSGIRGLSVCGKSKIGGYQETLVSGLNAAIGVFEAKKSEVG